MTAITSFVDILPTLIFGGSFGMILKTVLDHFRAKRAQTDNVALALVETLSAEVKLIKDEQRQERMLCEARLAVQRHKFNNLDASFDGLLMLYRVAPERAPEFIEDIIAQRRAQRDAEARESAGLMHAVLAAASLPTEPQAEAA